MNAKDKMKESFNSYQSAWVKYSSQKKNLNLKSHTFSFFEGEDRKYYNERIEKVTNLDNSGFECGGKHGVLSIYEKIRKELGSTNLLFFVDRDYGLSDVPENIYQTCYYSIENYYFGFNFINNLLKTEFGVNVGDDLSMKISRQFKDDGDLFYSCYKHLNAWYYNCKKHNIKIDKKFLRMDKHQYKDNKLVITPFKNIMEVHESYIEYVNDRKGGTNNYEYEKFSIDNTKWLTFEISDNEISFRGKFLFLFVTDFLKNLIHMNKSNQFSGSVGTSIKFNPESGNKLSELSKYAHTPESLNNYITSRIMTEN